MRRLRARHRQDPLATALGIRTCLAGQRVAFATATEWVTRLADAQRQGRLDEELRKLLWTPLLIVDEVGYSLRPASGQPDVLARQLPLRTREPDRHQQQAVLGLGRDLRRRGVAAAMIDRPVHHAEILSLKGDSYRLRDRDLGGRPPVRDRETG